MLRRATFNPQIYALHIGQPPSDAPDLDVKVAVHEPEAWSQSESDQDRMERIARALERSGIRARVAGIDVL